MEPRKVPLQQWSRHTPFHNHQRYRPHRLSSDADFSNMLDLIPFDPQDSVSDLWVGDIESGHDSNLEQPFLKGEANPLSLMINSNETKGLRL